MAKALLSLSSSIEHRMAGWEQIQYRLQHAPEPRLRPTITLSRQFGCEGFPLAEHLKALFEEATGEAWNIYDKALLEKVAHDEDISLRLLRSLGDMTHALEALGLHPSSHVSHDEAFAKVAKAVVQVGAMGNAILVGRGSAILCHGMPNCYHFRLEADFEWRVESLMNRQELSRKEAEELVRTSSRLRERFVSQCLGADVADLKHYCAVFNNGTHTIQEIGAAILAYVRCRWPEKGTFKA